MWKRLQEMIRCPQCAGHLRLAAFAEQRVVLDEKYVARGRECGTLNADFAIYIDAGVLLCPACAVLYPIFDGLPVLLPYATGLHAEFGRRFKPQLDDFRGFRFAACEPALGERSVQRSFSTEWLAYDFDGVIWEMDYADHERRFLLELGDFRPRHQCETFLEVGCGIGITTELAQKNFGVDAIGIDLSLAAVRATARHRDNPFLHFIQASIFYLPFAREAFDTIYSRGVLHHTYSTANAFASLATFCRPGGSAYLWVYGPRSTSDNLLRRSLFVAERTVRGWLSGRDDGLLAKVILTPLACAYMVFNYGRRARDETIQPYNFRRAMHAARDRFTPEFAHRHDHAEVRAWFERAGFVDIEEVDWRVMPTADQDDYRRNTGVRGRKTQFTDASKVDANIRVITERA